MALQLERAPRARRAARQRPDAAPGLGPGDRPDAASWAWSSGLLALPLGVVLAALLIHVINRRSFGWTLHLDLSPAILVQAVLLALSAALLLARLSTPALASDAAGCLTPAP